MSAIYVCPISCRTYKPTLVETDCKNNNDFEYIMVTLFNLIDYQVKYDIFHVILHRLTLYFNHCFLFTDDFLQVCVDKDLKYKGAYNPFRLLIKQLFFLLFISAYNNLFAQKASTQISF